MFGKAAAYLKGGHWNTDASALPAAKRIPLRLFRFVTMAWGAFAGHRGKLHAAALTYFTLTTVVPVLCLVLLAAKYLGLGEFARKHINEQIEQRSAVLDLGLQEILIAERDAHVAHADEEPERRIGGVAIARVGPRDHIADGPVLHERGELDQDLFDVLVEHRFGDEAADENERIASPVEEPRITGDHGLQVAAFDDERFQAVQHDGLQVVGHPVIARLFLRHGRNLRFVLACHDLADQMQRFVAVQGALEVARAVKVAVRIEAAFGFVFLIIHVRPLVSTAERAA